MLRPTPQPPIEICLGIDVGSPNCGFCLFDSRPAAQKILYLAKTQLLDEHAYVVHDPAEVERHLDMVVHQVETMLNGRPYYCSVEMQCFDLPCCFWSGCWAPPGIGRVWMVLW
jgi:hypothetical protein